MDLEFGFQQPAGIPLDHLSKVAEEAMVSRGLRTDFSADAMGELQLLGGPIPLDLPNVKDLRFLTWASIDNEDTRDIDQLAYAEQVESRRIRLLVAVADVSGAIAQGSALDRQAQENTFTVYTTGKIFPMLPEQLSTDWTSLGLDAERRALVTEMVINSQGDVESSVIYEAAVKNKAKLAYSSVSIWLEGGEPPPLVCCVAGMDEQVKLQMLVGQRLAEAARRRGALEFEADRVLPLVANDRLVGLEEERKNLASEAVANMMIATNTATARFLQRNGYPVFERVVEPPERWDKMCELAGQTQMPAEMVISGPQASSAALSAFLRELKSRDPKLYGEVSIGMLKLMGGGDYVVTPPGSPLRGHFGQGLSGGENGYVHSTAPNRRFPDVIVQRLVKAALHRQPCPYKTEELIGIAQRCNQKESATRGAERQVSKAAVAEFLSTQVGNHYEATITGKNSKKGVFVKVADPPIEGKLVEGHDGLDVGDKVRVELYRVDPARGFIDFRRVAGS